MTNLKALGHRLIWTPAGAWTTDEDAPRTRAALTAEATRRVTLSEYEQRMIRPTSRLAAGTSRPAAQAEPTFLTDADAELVGTAIGEHAAILGYVLDALAVLEDHVELVMRHHRDRPEDSIEQLKHAARMKLHAHDSSWVGHPVWANGGWSIPLERRAQLASAIEAVRSAAGQAGQHWEFLDQSGR
ncbi:MAG: hypothetical protein ACLFVH_08650 [Phycisphaerae bacterium]